MTLNSSIASVCGTQLSLGGFLRRLHAQGRLGPLVREALRDQFVVEQARQAGLTVSQEELQAEADDFRRRHGLNSTADTRAWLAARGLSADEFEAQIEETALAGKLRNHLTAAHVEGYFAAHAAEFDLLRLTLVVVERDDLARELASQVRDEGRDLNTLAVEHGLALIRREQVCKDMEGPLAEALAAAKIGDPSVPVATPQGFVLAVLEERRPAELTAATRRRIQNELFETWLSAKMKEVTLDLDFAGNAGWPGSY
jgi:hypothetical protein